MEGFRHRAHLRADRLSLPNLKGNRGAGDRGRTGEVQLGNEQEPGNQADDEEK